MRFARLRLEKRQNYVRKIAELTTQHFITNDRPNVVRAVQVDCVCVVYRCVS